jgi:Bacterial PH domain
VINYAIAVPGIVISAAIGVAMAVWLALNYAVYPKAYEIRGETLLVRRRWVRAMKIPLRDIIGVSGAPALADVPRRGLRRSFNAGVFGYHGPFQLVEYGKAFFVATHRERLVAIARRNNMTLIVSPQRPRDFTEALREALIRDTAAGNEEHSAQNREGTVRK